MWNDAQIKKHRIAAEELIDIKNKVFSLIKKSRSTNELEVSKFICAEFKKRGLRSDKDIPLVAFMKNTSHVHYFPKKRCKSIAENSLIMIDIWARMKTKSAPYADITWVAYKGKSVPNEVQKVFDVVIKTRNACLDYMRNKLNQGVFPTGKEINELANDLAIKNGYGKLKHSVGHSLGFYSPHGNRAHLRNTNKNSIQKNIGYTIEPGIYIENKFGVRSEINFYVSEDNKLIVTTPMQKEIILL